MGRARSLCRVSAAMSKSQLLAWINEFLGLSYTHIEQTCSGVPLVAQPSG